MGDVPAVRQENQLRALKTLEINLLDFYDGAQLFIERSFVSTKICEEVFRIFGPRKSVEGYFMDEGKLSLRNT